MTLSNKLRATTTLTEILTTLDDIKDTAPHYEAAGYLITEKEIDDLRAAVMDALHALNS